ALRRVRFLEIQGILPFRLPGRKGKAKDSLPRGGMDGQVLELVGPRRRENGPKAEKERAHADTGVGRFWFSHGVNLGAFPAPGLGRGFHRLDVKVVSWKVATMVRGVSPCSLASSTSFSRSGAFSIISLLMEVG